MPRFRITYVRTTYMEMEVAARDTSEAEARFEQLAAAKPFVCDDGRTLTAPRYRIVDVVPVDAQVAAPSSAEPTPIQPELPHLGHFSHAA